MKAIAVTCPHCGARVQVTGDPDTVRCEYCGTTSVIQRRTRVLERVLPPPPNQQRMPVAVQRRGSMTAISLLGTLLPIGIGIGATVYVQRYAQQAVHTAGSTAGRAASHAPDAPEWQGTDGAIVLASGDILGRSRRVRQADEVRAILLDGASGTPRWESAPLGTYSDTYQGKLALAGDLIVFASPRAEVRALALADGKERWRTQLDERVAQLCDGGTDVIIVVATDDVARPLLRATGKPAGTLAGALELDPKPPKKPKPKPKACTRLPTDGSDDTTASSSNYDLGRKLDLSINRVLPLPDGRLVSGQREKGTRVPTLVSLDAKQHVRWKIDVPIDPLGSQERAPEALALGEHEACAAYYAKNITEPPHLACFALTDGHRTWDVVAGDRSISMLRVVAGGLLVGSTGTLELRELATGTPRWTFGR